MNSLVGDRERVAEHGCCGVGDDGQEGLEEGKSASTVNKGIGGGEREARRGFG